jgi:type I restriction enzyme S subunit
MYYLFNGQGFISQIESHATGSDLPHISGNDILTTAVPLPPAEEQAEIVRRIESAFGWLDRMAADHGAAARLLPKLDAAILAKAFQGKLVPQDPNDEPAAKLLERIKAERETSDAQPKRGRGRPRTQVIRPAFVDSDSEVFPPTVELRKPAKPRKSAMTKSRQDDDVKDKPYLAGLLKSGRYSDAQSLFRAADLPVADFYKQLAWEIDNGHILDNAEELKAA